MEVLAIVAIVVGPVSAVLITRHLDWRNELRRRKYDILVSLMRTRASRLSAEHVGALNMIQLEFHNRKRITEAYSQYINHLSLPLPPVPEQEAFFEQRQDRFLQLISAIAADLRYRFDRRDLDRFSYSPQAWDDIESVQRRNLGLLSDVLSGKRPLHITTWSPSTESPFPPRPD